jgi:hypothetical protein
MSLGRGTYSYLSDQPAAVYGVHEANQTARIPETLCLVQMSFNARRGRRRLEDFFKR